MDDRDPVAFISYVRADDEHDHGRITALRERLEGELRMQLGRHFHIFQDKKDIKWGQQWKKRLDDTLLNVTFLIPVVTPAYFTSNSCRDEFDKFPLREKQLGEDRPILPIYYVSSDSIDDIEFRESDEIAKVIASRNWADWRKLRFKDLRSAEVESAVSDMAVTIKSATRDIDKIIAASKKVPEPRDSLPPEHMIIKDFPSAPAEVRRKKTPRNSDASEYVVYTVAYDEEITAESLSTPAELKKLATYLLKSINQYKTMYRDVIFKFGTSIKELDKDCCAVTILIDNSGSMRGRKITSAAAWSYILAEILEKAGIAVEVLGYTTRAWKGGQSREMWLLDGKPSNPGRLNDIRHIIYKDYNSKMTDIRNNFGLMVREGLLKENIDGESVNWAYNRLLFKEQSKKLLLVINDGAPVDDSTMSANKDTLLSDHLFSIVEQIEAANKALIFGIGLEFDCSKFYEESAFVPDSGSLGAELLSSVAKLLRK